MTPHRFVVAAAAALAAAVPAFATGPAAGPAPFPVAAPPPPAGPQTKTGWFDTAELGYVQTSGNAASNSYSFKNTLVRAWTASTLTLKISGVRAESTDISRRAVGVPGDYVVVEDRTNRLAAENYIAALQYDRKVSQHLFWFAGGGWDRNRFAGIENRYVAAAGVGTIWRDDAKTKFKTEYGVSDTRREDMSGETDNYLGWRLGWDWSRKLGATATLANQAVLDGSLKHGGDWRGDMTSSLSVVINKNLALKASLRWLLANEPASTDVDLYDPTGAPTGLKVPAELRRLDTFVTTSLVVNF